MKYVITALLSVALIWTSQIQAAPINNQVHANKQTVSAAAPEKVAQAETPKITAITVNAPVQSESPDPELEAKAFIYLKESSNNPAAQNSIGCYGLGQDCNGIVKDKCSTDYQCQDDFFTDYMIRRYGSWSKAKEFWLARVPINGVDRGNWW